MVAMHATTRHPGEAVMNLNGIAMLLPQMEQNAIYNAVNFQQSLSDAKTGNTGCCGPNDTQGYLAGSARVNTTAGITTARGPALSVRSGGPGGQGRDVLRSDGELGLDVLSRDQDQLRFRRLEQLQLQ